MQSRQFISVLEDALLGFGIWIIAPVAIANITSMVVVGGSDASGSSSATSVEASASPLNVVLNWLSGIKH